MQPLLFIQGQRERKRPTYLEFLWHFPRQQNYLLKITVAVSSLLLYLLVNSFPQTRRSSLVQSGYTYYIQIKTEKIIFNDVICAPILF